MGKTVKFNDDGVSGKHNLERRKRMKRKSRDELRRIIQSGSLAASAAFLEWHHGRGTKDSPYAES